MKKLLVLLPLIFCSCTAHYKIDENHVEHISWNEGVGKVVTRIEGADPRTFEQLLPYFGKDKSHVYWQGTVVKGADPSSFIAINNYYGVDANHGVITERIIQESDGSSFEYIGNNWSRDSLSYFYMGNELDICDYESFEIIEDVLSDRAQDKECYYSKNNRVQVEDRASLVILPAGYAKDSNGVYWGHFVIQDADPATFEAKKTKRFARDSKACYVGPSILECKRMSEEAKEYCFCD